MITTLASAVESGRYPGLGMVLVKCQECADWTLLGNAIGGCDCAWGGVRLDLRTVLVSDDLTPKGVRELVAYDSVCDCGWVGPVPEVECPECVDGDPNDHGAIYATTGRILIWDGWDTDWGGALWEECFKCDGWGSDAACGCVNSLRALPIAAVILYDAKHVCDECGGTEEEVDSGVMVCPACADTTMRLADPIPAGRIREWISACDEAGVQAVIGRWLKTQTEGYLDIMEGRSGQHLDGVDGVDRSRLELS